MVENASKPARAGVNGGALAWVFCIVWLFSCLGGLVWLLQQTLIDGRIQAEVLQWTVWPFVVLGVSVPILIVIFASGDRVLSRLVEVKSLVDNLGPNLDRMQRFSNLLKEASERMASASAQSVSAAEANAAQAISNSAPSDKKKLADRLMEHYYDAKEVYARAAEKYGVENLFSKRGYVDQDNVDILEDDKKLTPREAAYVKTVLKMEAGSRRDGRKSLTDADLASLDALRSAAK